MIKDDKTLWESGELHKTLVEAAGQAGIGIVILQNTKEKEAAIVAVNEQATRISGYSEEESLKMTLYDVIPSDIIGQIMSRYRERQQGKPVPASYEAAIVRKDKTRVPIIISPAAMKLQGEAATAVYFRDITEVKKAQEKIKQLQEYLQMQIDRMPIGLIIWDKDFRVKTWNPAATNIFGFTKEEALGKHSYDLIVSQKAQPTVDKIWTRLLKGDLSAHSINENITKDGKTIICDWTNTPLKEADGVTKSVLSMVQDITERKKAEEEIKKHTKELEEEKAKDEAILFSIGEGLFVVNSEGKLILVNRAFEEQLGWKKEEVLGKSFVEQIPAQDEEGNCIPPDKCPVTVALVTGKEMTEFSSGPGYYLVRKNKTRFPIACKVTLVKLGGKTVGAMGVFRDITREKEIDRMKTEFLSVAAHQLRTPLANMRWKLEMLLGKDFGELTEQAKQTLEQVLSNNLWMVTLVNDLLDVSRIDQGKVLDEPEITDVIKTIDDVILDLKVQSEKKGVIIEVKTVKIDKIMIDSKRLHQIIENLLTNAINYNYSGGKVSVSLKQEENYLIISVSDTGIGIPQKDQTKIFSKFFRAENAIHSKIEGTGLGLFVVKFYVEKWGGKVWFESNEGKGSTFYIKIPMKGENRE